MSTPFVGDVLLVENLNPSGFPKPTIYYQWLRDGENISGASGATYEVITEDSGTALGVSILIKNIYGQSTKVITTGESEGTIELPSFTTQPYLTSSQSPPVEQVPIVIEDLNTGGFPTPAISYKWYRGASLISGETSSSYTPTASDVGHTLAAEITATNVGGSAVTTIYTDFPVERADLDLSYISIISPVYGGYVAETINDAVGYDVLSYNWQANTGSNYVTFSTDPVRTTVSSDYIGFPIRCKLTASRSGETDIEVTSSPVTVSQVAGQPAASFNPQGVLEPGSGFGSSFVEKSTTKRVGNADVFASESHSIFRFGIPDHYTMDADGFTLDMYAFHGSGIDSVTISCDGGTAVTAGFEQTGGDTGEGYFYLGISADKFPAGGTFEVRATANPVNGYARSQQLFLTHATGENKISIDTSTTWRDAYDTLLETYDESKRNIIELTESGEYLLEGENNSYRGFSFGWIEVVPAEGVVPVVDVSMTGNNRDNEDDDIDPRLNSLQVKNCIFRRNIADDGNENHDPGIKTVYWEPDNRMWFFGCTFESDWFDTGSWESLDPPRQNPFVQIRQLQKISFTDCHFEQTANGPTRAYLCKNVTSNKVLKDAYTNVRACINSQSIDKLKPAKVELHADHWQNFNHGGDLTVENRILYGYTGADYSTTIQPFFFSPLYHDGIAIVHCNWSGPVGPATAAVNYTYDHLVFIGLELEDRKLRFSNVGDGQTGPVLLRGINASKIHNERLHELDILALVGTTNEFRVENCTPDVRYLGDPESDSLLNTKYQWHIPGTSMASVNDFNTYPLDPTGSNTDFYIGVTAGGPSGPKRTTDVFKSNESGRLGYWSEGDAGVRAFTLNNLRDLESANDLVDQDWYMTVITDEGSMTSSRFERDDDSTNCVFKGFKDQIFSGVTMALNDFIGGVTLELKTAIDITDRARWLTDSTPSETFPVPGATLNVVLGSYEGDPTPTVSYVWKKDPLGGTNYSVISGVTGATLDLTANPLAADTSIRCDVSITNSASSETQYVDFGKVADWNTYRDGIFRFPTPLTTSYGNTIQVESSVEFAGLTQASLVDADEDFRLKFDSGVSGEMHAAVWDGSAWSTYKSWDSDSTEQRFSDLFGSGGAPSENEIVVLYRNDPGDPSQFNDYPEEPPSATALVSGSGFGSDFDPAEETQIGSDSSVYGYHAKSIAHFTTIPYEEYRSGDFRISVMAYHCNDIDRVEFTLNGGSTVSVTQRELNSITDAHEFYVKLDENSFAAMGATAELLDIRAKIVPKVAGVTRSLQMKMQRPIRERTVMWVDSVNGSDDTGDGSETNPYQSISKPIIVHQANSNPSGSEQFLGACSYLTVYLKEGSYHTTFEGVSGVGYPSTQYSYLQIMGAPGTNKNLVEITSSENVRNPPTKFTKYKNLTISQNLTPTKVKQGQDLYPDEEPVLYFEGVEWVGDANADPMTFRPYLNTFDEAFMYNCNMYNIAAGPLYSTKMINTNMLNVRADSYTGCQLVVNGNVEGTTPEPGDHADVWQVACSVGEVSTGNTENNLVYNLKSIDADAQLIFLGDCESYTNTAFVNCLLARESGVYSKDPPISRIGGRINHLLLYNCCLPNQKLLIETDGSVSGFDPDCSGSCVDSEGNPIGRDPECECGGAGAYNVDIRGNIFSELDLSTNVQQNYTDGRVKIESNHFVSQTSWGTDGSTGDPEFAGVSYTPTTEQAGTWYTVVYDPDEGYIAFSPSITSPVRRNFYNPQVPMDIFAIERDNPSILGPIQNTNYPIPPTDGTFTDLRALISKSSGVLDLNGSTFEAETSDFDPDDSYRGAIRINASDFTEVKNGTIIAGRKGSWNGPDSNGIYSADLTSTEVADFLFSPRFYLYDPTLSEQPGLALYPEAVSTMTPRYTLGYHSNFLYTKSAERFDSGDRGYVYTHGRTFTLSTAATYQNDDFQSDDVLYLGQNTNETTATAKGIVHRFRNITSTNPTPTVHLSDIYYRDGSGEFVLDTREGGNFDQSTYNTFNAGDVVTNARTGQTYTMETTTNLDSEGAQIYGFRLTHQPSIDTVNNLFSDGDNKSFSIIAKTKNNVIVTGYVTSYNQTTGIFEFDSNVSRYLGYFNFVITGIPEVINTVSYASYSLDPANNKMLYKPASGTPENIYIPNMRHGVILKGKGNTDVTVPTIKLTNLKFYLGNSATTSPGTLRQTDGPFNLTIDNCRFQYNAQGLRFTQSEDSNVHVKNSIFKDNAHRFTSGFGPGVTVERNIFDGTQSSSALNPNFPNDGNTAEVQELVVIKDNIFSLPATNHGQAISAYEAAHTNILIEHNIFYNCQRPSSAQFGSFASDPPPGGTCEYNNNLMISDEYVDNVTLNQSGIAFQGGDKNVNIGTGEHKIFFRSNTMFVNHQTAQPDGSVIVKPCQIHQQNTVKSTVKYLNNFVYGGIVPSTRVLDEELGDGVPHNFANNFSDGFVFDPEMISFNTAFGSTDIKLPAGLTLSDVYGITTCAMTGPLATGGSDGGSVGIRWNPIPTTQQITDILTNETTNWADTYPALSIPLTPGEVAYSTAFAGEDNRVGALVPLQPIGTTYDVRVVDIGADDEHSRVFSIDGNIYTEIRLNTGVTYEFSQSHISNIGYGFLLSATADGTNAGGTAFTDGFSYTGTPGSDGVATFVPPSGSPSVLYYYADGESGMGGAVGITSA